MFPVNFLVGAAVGAAATYIYKDDSSKQRLGEIGNKLKEGSNSIMAVFKKTPENTAENTAEVVEAVAEKTGETQEAVIKA